MPDPYDKLSVFQIADLTEGDIWIIGSDVANKQGKNLKGRADISSSDVIGSGLKIDPDNDPPHHANIIDWPATKSERKLIATELANKANLKLPS